MGGGGAAVPSICPKERKTRAAATLFLSSAFLAWRHRENQGNKFSEPETNSNLSLRLIKVWRLSLDTFSTLLSQLVVKKSGFGLFRVWLVFWIWLLKNRIRKHFLETKASPKSKQILIKEL